MSPITLRLREIRRMRGLTQIQLAERAHVRQATVSDIEAGKTRGIDFDTLERLAVALEIDPALLVARVPSQRRRS